MWLHGSWAVGIAEELASDARRNSTVPTAGFALLWILLTATHHRIYDPHQARLFFSVNAQSEYAGNLMSQLTK